MHKLFDFLIDFHLLNVWFQHLHSNQEFLINSTYVQVQKQKKLNQFIIDLYTFHLQIEFILTNGGFCIKSKDIEDVDDVVSSSSEEKNSEEDW